MNIFTLISALLAAKFFEICITNFLIVFIDIGRDWGEIFIAPVTVIGIMMTALGTGMAGLILYKTYTEEI